MGTSACTNRTRTRFWKEIQLKILVLSPGTLYVQQINYLSISFYVFGHGVVTEKSTLGHGSLIKNMA
jgi:hypothetical protein